MTRRCRAREAIHQCDLEEGHKGKHVSKHDPLYKPKASRTHLVQANLPLDLYKQVKARAEAARKTVAAYVRDALATAETDHAAVEELKGKVGELVQKIAEHERVLLSVRRY